MNKSAISFIFCVIIFSQIESSSKGLSKEALSIVLAGGALNDENQPNNSSRKRSLNQDQDSVKKAKINSDLPQNIFKDQSVQTESGHVAVLVSQNQSLRKALVDAKQKNSDLKGSLEMIKKVHEEAVQDIFSLQNTLINKDREISDLIKIDRAALDESKELKEKNNN